MKKGNNPIDGIFVGILFVIGGLILLWWNEGRTVKTEAAIKEAEKTYIDVSSDSVNKENEGKLIATNGLQTRASKISDDVFDKIITKYQLEPSNHLVDLLYEALMFENNNK